MNNVSAPRSTFWRWLRIVGTAIVCLLILGGAAAAIVVINMTEPKAQQIKMTRKSAALVETVTVKRDTHSPRLVVLGTVEPAQDITLSPRVSGQVIELAPGFVPGGTVSKGELLLKIDPSDFDNVLAIRQSELEQAEASLKIELGRKTLAEKELALLEGTIGEANRELVLREPQIDSIQAEISAAQAAIERAMLDLERTSIHAPFDAQILSRSVNVGSQVGSGDELARLVGVEEYWIMASLPIRNLRWLQFPKQDGEGSSVTVYNPGSWPDGTSRQGTVARMIGTLDQQTRLARVLITVSDPLARETDAPPLIIGTLLETHIEGRPIENVVQLDRQYVRDQDTVWVLQDGKLDIRPVEIVLRDSKYAYIRSGLEDGDQVVTTTLATPSAGIGLRKVDDLPQSEAADDESQSEGDKLESGQEATASPATNDEPNTDETAEPDRASDSSDSAPSATSDGGDTP